MDARHDETETAPKPRIYNPPRTRSCGSADALHVLADRLAGLAGLGQVQLHRLPARGVSVDHVT